MKKRDYAVEIGGCLATLFMGGTMYCMLLLLMEALANKVCAWLNALILNF